MSNLDHERLREIESSAKKVDELAKILDFQRQETKLARQAWEEAVERHLELCRATEDSQDVAKAPLLKRIEELGAEANGQPIVADAVTEPPEPAAEHEEDDPDWHGEPVVDRDGGWTDEYLDATAEGDRIAMEEERDKAEADALAAIESGAKKAKSRKRSKAQQG
jgi:hypothetical protein